MTPYPDKATDPIALYDARDPGEPQGELHPRGAAQPRVRVTGRRPLAIKLSTCRHRFHRSYLLRAESRWRG